MKFKDFARKNESKWLTPKQVARLMQCSKEHVYDLAKSGRISYIRDGKNIRFKPEDLDDYEKSNYVRRNNGTTPKRPKF